MTRIGLPVVFTGALMLLVVLLVVSDTSSKNKIENIHDRNKRAVGGCFPMELVFVLQDSKSIDTDNWVKVQSFAKSLAGKFPIAKDKVQVSVVRFGSSAELKVKLSDTKDLAEAEKNIDGVSYKDMGDPNLGKAFVTARGLALSTAYGARNDVAKVIVALTDQATSDAAKLAVEATKLADNLIFTYAVGVGGNVDVAELNSFATNPNNDHVFTLSNYDGLSAIVDQIATKICDDVDRDECASNPCQNGAQCVDGVGKYTCKCSKKYIGDICELECAPVDIGLILDTSGSITIGNWEGAIVPFVENLITNLTIGPDESRIGAVGFSTDSYFFWNLEKHTTEQKLLSAIRGIDYNTYKGYTNSPGGIKLAETEIFQKNIGDRDNVKNIAIFFNDGKCNRQCDKLKEYSNDLKKNRDTTVYSIAIGPNVVESEVKEVASDPDSDFLLKPQTFEELLEFVYEIKKGICKNSKPAVVVDPCNPAPCKNGGQCTQNNGVAECKCASGFKGPVCDTDIDECLSGPCKNGICIDKANGYTCKCNPGWSGTHCDTENDPCSSNPCKNGACVNTNGVYSCTCDKNWTGNNCDTPVDPCDPNPCKNGACSSSNGVYTCKCDAGWKGNNCDQLDDNCVGHKCKNGGKCQNSLNSYTCICAAGYAGTYCDIDIDECLSTPCKNGGICTDKVNGYACGCPPGYKGTNCDVMDTNCDSDDICFILDSSASLMQANWENVKLFTNKIVDNFAVGPNDMQIGVVVYSSTSSVPIKLDNGLGKDALKKAISDLTFIQTGTATHLGLSDTRTVCFNNAGDRPNSKNKAFLVTDGKSVSPVDTSSAALAARNANIQIFAIGVGRASMDELLAITGDDAGKVFLAPDFTTLLDSVAKIIGTSCDARQDTDGCTSDPCQNNGRCLNNMGQYTCNCSNTQGFTGNKCEIAPSKDSCDNNDICFLVDASSSIPPNQEWQDMLTFITTIIGGLPDSANIGVVLFSLDTSLHTQLGPWTDRNALITNIMATPRTGGSTMTHLGLKAVKDQCFAGPSYRTSTWNKAFLITDGKSYNTDLMTQEAVNLRQKADIFAVGVGRYNYTELKLITDDESRIFTALSFADLAGIASKVLAGSCQNPDLCNPNPCKNSGACSSSGTKYTCTCLTGWTGTNCDTPVDSCASAPCKNGGVCTPTGATTYSCKCSTGWIGNNCDIPNTGGCDKDDVCLLVDASGSIPSSDWGKVTNFLKTLVNEWTIGPNDVQVGVVVFSSNATLAWGLNAYQDKVTLTSKMDSLIHFRMGTATDVGLDVVRTNCFGTSGDRSSNKNKVFLLTDGKSKDKTLTLAAAKTLRDQQNEIYVIGVGTRLDESELLGIVGNDANKVIKSASFDDLAAKAAEVIKAACNSPNGPTDDPCAPNPCVNGGACSASGTVFTCNCPPGFSGATCHIDTNECASTPCKNGGNCLDGKNGYFCVCPQGTSGALCENDANECASAPCKNGGVCSDQVNAYSCSCPAGFSGTNCETTPDFCASGPCQNGGVCSSGASGYTCTCAVGYSGTNCGTNIDECASSPCQNGGVCSDAVNSYTCSCATGYTGTNCETAPPAVNNCDSSPCQNGGVCSNSPTQYTCSCAAGYSGTNCETDTNECASTPCQNGGVCTDAVNSYSCSCAAGFTGTNCGTALPSTTASSCIACSSTHIAFGADCTTIALEGWVYGEMDTYEDADLGTQTCTKGCYLRLQGGVATRGCVESLAGDATLTGVLPSYIADGATICYPTADKICFCQGDDCSSTALDSNDGDPSMAGRDLTDTSMSVCDCGSCRKECSTSPSNAQCDCSASCGCVYN